MTQKQVTLFLSGVSVTVSGLTKDEEDELYDHLEGNFGESINGIIGEKYTIVANVKRGPGYALVGIKLREQISNFCIRAGYSVNT